MFNVLCLPAILSSAPGSHLHSLLSSYTEPSTRDHPFPSLPLSAPSCIYHHQRWIKISHYALISWPCNIHRYSGPNPREHPCSPLLSALIHALLLQPTFSHSESSFGIQPMYSDFWIITGQRACALSIAWVLHRSNNLLYSRTVRIYSAAHCRYYHPGQGETCNVLN